MPTSPRKLPITAQARPASPVMAGAVVLAVLALLAAPLAVYPVFLMQVMCFALFASAFNLLLGYSGLLSFGHALFFGGSSYVCAYAAKTFGLTPELAILAGTAFSVVAGAIVGLLAIRRQGIYFAMVTLALAQMFFFFCLQTPLTGGEDGLQNVPRRPLFGLIDVRSDRAFYYVVLVIFLFGFALIHRTIHSPFGQVLRSIRENEPRAISLGYRVRQFKMVAFLLSAALTGLAGATKAMVFQLASLTDVTWQMSGEVILMALVGGLGTPIGPVVGALVIVAMQNYLASLGEWVLVIQGVIFVAVVSFFRAGIVGQIEVAWTWFRQPPAPLVPSSVPGQAE